MQDDDTSYKSDTKVTYPDDELYTVEIDPVSREGEVEKWLG